MPTLERDGPVMVLDLGDGENRFTPDWIASVNAALDEVAGQPGEKALVTTAGGRFFSNGLDLPWLLANPGDHQDLIRSVQALFARVLDYPVPTVAAIPGHAFAGGAMLTVTHDFALMRAEHGYWCVNEVDLGIPPTAAMTALLQARIPARTLHEALTTGRRYGGHQAREAGIIHDTADTAADVLSAAIAIARPLVAKAGPTLGQIKARLYAEAITCLRDAEIGPLHLPSAPTGASGAAVST